jgi:putative transposase
MGAGVRWTTSSSSACSGETLKYEEIYLRNYQTVPEAIRRLGAYFTFYNSERLHQALNYQTPEAVYRNLARARESRIPP